MAENTELGSLTWNPETGEFCLSKKDGKLVKDRPLDDLHRTRGPRASPLFSLRETMSGRTEQMEWLERVDGLHLKKIDELGFEKIREVGPCPLLERLMHAAFESGVTRVLIKARHDVFRPEVPDPWIEQLLSIVDVWKDAAFELQTRHVDRLELSGLERPSNLTIRVKASAKRSSPSAERKPKSKAGNVRKSQLDDGKLSSEHLAERTEAVTKKEGKGSMKVKEIPVNEIGTGSRLRTHIDEASSTFEALKRDIKDNGLMQPIVVVSGGEGKYQLVAGARRLRVFKKLDWPAIPAVVYKSSTTEERCFLAELLENVLRDDLNPMDQAEAYLQLYRLLAKKNGQKEGKELTGEDLRKTLVKFERNKLSEPEKGTMQAMVDTVGKTARTIENVLYLLKLPDSIKKGIAEGKIEVTIGYILAAKKGHEKYDGVVKKLEAYVSGKGASSAMTVKQVREEFAPERSSFVNRFESSLKRIEAEIEANDFPPDDARRFLDKLKGMVAKMKDKAALRVAS